VVLLLAVVAFGSPRFEIHTHESAGYGHAHHAHGLNEAVQGAGVMHAHDVGASLLTLVPEFNVYLAKFLRTEDEIPPATAKPPDNIVAPLYRPPIV